MYYYWLVVSRTEWKLAPDPLESAQKFVEQHGAAHQVALLPLQAVRGVEVLAFEVRDFVERWAEHTRELAMDSTCECPRLSLWLTRTDDFTLDGTNSSNCELFAAVAGAKGSGIPLAYCLIQTKAEAEHGAKEAVLTDFLTRLKERNVNPEFTLSDKDWSEINAMRAVWPCS